MAVQDLWIGRNGQPTSRHGRGRRYRVVVPGHPSKSFTTKRPAEMHEAKLLVSEPSAVIAEATVGDLVDAWVLTKAHLFSLVCVVPGTVQYSAIWHHFPGVIPELGAA